VTARPPRSALRGPRGCVAADHPLAAAAGLKALLDGGSAADAALAAAAVMPVVQPHYNHLGGDLFALVFDASDGAVHALNSSGPAPRALDPEVYRRLGAIPADGPLAVTVPGCVDGWWQLHRRFGSLPWSDVLAAATGYAASGFPASRRLVEFVESARPRVYPGDFFKRTFGHVGGEGGQLVVQPELARTFGALREGGAAGFYSGSVAESCVEALNARGACFSLDEWRGPARWEEPLDVAFAGYRVWSQPPPTQGFVLLDALRRLEGAAPAEPRAVIQARAIESALTVARAEAGDPDFSPFDARAVLAAPPREPAAATALSGDGDTTYVLAVDGEGNAVSLIQSVFGGWGCGVFDPRTGVLFNNRMLGFTLKEGHPNEIAPGKRPYHTLHSYLVTVDAPAQTPLARKLDEPPPAQELRVVGGSPGAQRQPQTNLQVLDAILAHGVEPQAALDAPRWSFDRPGAGSGEVEVEAHDPGDLAGAFAGAGFAVRHVEAWSGMMGRSFVATVDHRGVAVAGDQRGEGVALAI
jgi:gamma-glutamyltranspeptidase/glutathione hydrolase